MRCMNSLDDTTIEPRRRPRVSPRPPACRPVSPHPPLLRAGGLVRPARNASGYREYSAFDLRRLVFLTRMRLSGMTMQDLKRYIALVEQGPSTIPERRRIMLDQRDRIVAADP